MSILTSLIQPVANIAGGIIKNRQEINAAKHQAKLARLQNDADWEARAMDASANSWKDEFWTIILSIPIFAIGYSIVMDDPEIIARTKLAFTALEDLPDYFQMLLFIAISSSFGLKGVDRLMQLRKK